MMSVGIGFPGIQRSCDKTRFMLFPRKYEINIHFRPVRTRWSGSTSRMRVICEARNANLLSRTRLIAVSVVYWWVGNLYDVCIGLTELGGLSQSPCKME